MKELILHDDGQLRRIERAIAAVETRPMAMRLRQQDLLSALIAERNALLAARGRTAQRRQPLEAC